LIVSWINDLSFCQMALLVISLNESFDACFGLLEEVEVGQRFLEVSVLTDAFPACLAIFQVFRFFSFNVDVLYYPS